MAYLGNVPARSFISFERQVFTIVNSQTAYTLSHSVTNENDIRLVVNNVVQEPGSGKAYTASGTTLTLSAALTNGTDEMYCVFLGRAVGTVNAPAGSINNSQISYPLAQSGAVVSQFNRTSDNGTIANFQKDGTVVGSLGTDSTGDFVIDGSSGHSGIRFKDTVLVPKQNGSDVDNTIDLGKSDKRWKDLYLGGGLLVGGTGTANKLDDYEEGTWTPTWTNATASDATYTKIGRVVYASGIFTAGGSATTGTCGGLPFSSAIDGADGGGSGYHTQDTVTWSVLKISSTLFRFYTGSTQKQLNANEQTRFFLTYMV
jgi:hypothetical protein